MSEFFEVLIKELLIPFHISFLILILIGIIIMVITRKNLTKKPLTKKRLSLLSSIKLVVTFIISLYFVLNLFHETPYLYDFLGEGLTWLAYLGYVIINGIFCYILSLIVSREERKVDGSKF
ncbi:MAG: hypothetical protein ACTSVZ_04580 [Promethearchaeota archaeon]